MSDSYLILVRKLREHSPLSSEDISAVRDLSFSPRDLDPNEDMIRQGDRPDVAALVVSGMVARYHITEDGRRQYLSFHMAGDLPDAQSLFIDEMDHAVCAMGFATVAFVPHREIELMFELRPMLGFAIWRETLIDAAIFRDAITNVSARDMKTRMAHLFCELFYRSRASGLTDNERCKAPISLPQLGETLGMAIATVNRTLSELRDTGTVDFRSGEITVHDWPRLAEIGQFDPRYLHQRKPPFS